MNKMMRRLLVLGAAMAIQGGAIGLAFAQATGGPDNNAAAGYQASATTSDAEASAADLPILYVTSVEVLRTSAAPQIDIVRVTGLTGSQGWSGPQLIPTIVGKPLDNILDLQFVAAEPVQSQPAEGFVPISAVFPLQEGHGFKGVRVRASENVIEVTSIPGHAEAAVASDGCKDCVGKKFAEKGKAAAGTSGVVREEDLPKILRWIPPDRGIRGITHDPNRLNLMLGSDSTIIAAYWE